MAVVELMKMRIRRPISLATPAHIVEFHGINLETIGWYLFENHNNIR